MGDATTTVLDRRPALAPFVGRRVAVRGTAMKGSVIRVQGRHVPTTLLAFADVLSPARARVGQHVWVKDADWVGWGWVAPGTVVDFTATVDAYPSRDPATQQYLTRYGLCEPGEPRPLGPLPLVEMIDMLAEVYGWDQVADAVAGCHPGNGAA